MSDLEKRLRNRADTEVKNLNHHGGTAWRKEDMLTWKAADEIERLQAVLDAAREETRFHCHGPDSIPCSCALCRALRAYDGEVKP